MQNSDNSTMKVPVQVSEDSECYRSRDDEEDTSEKHVSVGQPPREGDEHSWPYDETESSTNESVPSRDSGPYSQSMSLESSPCVKRLCVPIGIDRLSPSPLDISSSPEPEDEAIRQSHSFSRVQRLPSNEQAPFVLYACPPLLKRAGRTRVSLIRQLCQTMEHFQDSWEWDKFEFDAERYNVCDNVDLVAALLQLRVRQQCFQKTVNLDTLAKCDNMLKAVATSNNASFLEVEILTVKAWASWLIGRLADADRCLRDVLGKLRFLEPGKESGLFHYHCAFYLRYRYCLQQEHSNDYLYSSCIQLEPLWKRILWHYHQAVAHFEEENSRMDGLCSSLLLYSRLSLAQCALRTGVTISNNSWESDKVTANDIYEAKKQLAHIESELWHHVQPFTRLCYYTCKADLLFLQQENCLAYEMLQEAQNVEHQFKFGLDKIQEILTERLDEVRPRAEMEKRRVRELPSVSEFISPAT